MSYNSSIINHFCTKANTSDPSIFIDDQIQIPNHQPQEQLEVSNQGQSVYDFDYQSTPGFLMNEDMHNQFPQFDEKEQKSDDEDFDQVTLEKIRAQREYKLKQQEDQFNCRFHEQLQFQEYVQDSQSHSAQQNIRDPDIFLLNDQPMTSPIPIIVSMPSILPSLDRDPSLYLMANDDNELLLFAGSATKHHYGMNFYVKQEESYQVENGRNPLSSENIDQKVFEEMQPQQQEHNQFITQGHDSNMETPQPLENQPPIELLQQEEITQEDLEVQNRIQNGGVKNSKKHKKRGRPFNGVVSDNKEEKFKVRRQQILRDFKTFYEKRGYLKLYDINFVGYAGVQSCQDQSQKQMKEPKKKKVFKNNEDQESNLREVSLYDTLQLFDKNLFQRVDIEVRSQMIEAFYTLQNSRHYKKIGGDFSIIRDPMYSYRKDLKERMFRDNCFSFYWMFYRCLADFTIQPSDGETVQDINHIFNDFDGLATRSLHLGDQQLNEFIKALIIQVQPQPQHDFEMVTPGGEGSWITPGGPERDAALVQHEETTAGGDQSTQIGVDEVINHHQLSLEEQDVLYS